ncbi:hypothetical protein, partial [uncultured Oscillibacter sp.]|uniref:hypothetical protein n=1 Tax=uncultured Oscillibacter sp. TaxID=876091 RepID=UPI00272D7FBB
QGRYFLFSFGPCTARFLFFFWQEKEKMGGAMHQPSLVSNPPRPKGRKNPPFSGGKRKEAPWHQDLLIKQKSR